MQQLFEQEYPKYEKSLFLLAVTYLHNTEDARDVVQEAALAAWRNLHSLRQPEYFKTWLTRIVINRCKSFLRSRRETVELSDELGVFAELPHYDLEIMDAICRMDQNKAVYIALRFYHGMNYDEAAGALSQPVSTVKYRTKKALEELKNLLEGDV